MSTWAFSIAGILHPLQTGWQMQLASDGRHRFVGKVFSKDAAYRPALDDSVGVYERIPIATITAGNPTVITTAEPHGLVTGQLVNIGAVTGNTPPTINSTMPATVLSPVTFSVPLATTTAGGGGVAERAVFGGYTITPRERGILDEPVTPIYTELTAVSFYQIAERRYANEVLLSGTVKSMLATLVAHYMPQVAVSDAQVDGPVLPDVPCHYALVRDVLDTIAGLAGGYVWEIDAHLRARMYLPAAEGAPFSVIEGDHHAIGDVTVEPTRTNYANRVILQFTALAVPAYAFLQANTNFADGETVVVGSKTYTYQTTLTDADGNLAIGPDINTSLNTLVNAINLASGNYAPSMTKHSQVFGIGGGGTAIRVTALSAGASGNSIGVATTAAHAVWHGEGSAPLSSLALGADAALTNVAIAENTSEQSAHGIWETVVSAPDITDAGLAASAAQAELTMRLLVPQKVTYRTQGRGLMPGQRQTIVIPSRRVNGTFLLTDINGGNTRENIVEWTVTAIESLTPGAAPQWRDTYKQWSGGVGGSGGALSVAGVVSGGGGGGNGGGSTTLPAVIGETPAGNIDGVNQDFTTAGEYGTVLAVFLNGVRQSSPAHYKEHSPNRFTMTDPPLPGDVLKVDYGDTTGLPVGGGGGSAGYSGAGTSGYLTKWLDVREFGDSGVSEGTGYLAAAVAGTEVFRLTATEADIKLNALILGAAGDAVIMRDAPNAVGLRNATAPQVFRVYNTSSVSNTNFERGAVGWFSNSFEVRTEMQGSGAPRNLTLRVVDNASLYFSHTSVDRWYLGPTGSFCSAYDNVSDIGLSGTVGRPRDIWLGRNLNLGQDAMPLYPYTSNLGAIYRKYLTLYAAELWVETLVAQNTMATIGGRILVGPTNILTRDVAPADTVIYVKYNNFLLQVPGVEYGSKLWLESAGKFEMMFVTSTATPTAQADGSFAYSVLRNQDGSPANQWFAGDAVMDTGKTGSGFIDLYSLRGIKSVNEAGPTIVGNLRLSGAYNDWRPRWAIGNLANLYGYGTTVFGVGLGDPTDANITIDAGGPATATQPATASQGFRIRQGSIVKLQAVGGSLFLTGELVVGTAGLARSGATDFYSGNGWFFDYNNGNPRFRVGNPQGQRIAWDGSGTLTVVGAITVVGAPASGMAYADFSNVVAGYAASNAVRGAANDSAAIGGMAASTVQSGVNRANTGLDGNGSLLTAARPTYGVGAVLAGAGLYLGSDVMGFYNGGSWMTYMDNAGGFYLHGNAGNALYWNGSTLQVIGAVTATSGTFTGDVNVGTAGKLYCGMYTFGSGVGWLLEFNAGTPRFYCGNGGGNGVSWDGTNLQMRSNRVQITELGLKLYAAAARDLACSVYWDVGDTPGEQSSMGLFTQNVYNVERGITLENSSVADFLNQSFTVRMNAAIASSRHASIMCLAQTKTPAQDRIEFDCTSGAYRFMNLLSISGGTGVVFGSVGTAPSYIGTAASDERLKRNIVPFGTGMTALRQIVPIAFEPLAGGERTVGFSAQNVLPHVPFATPINPDGYYGFIDRAMIAVVVNALKELDARVATLEG